mgnify:CR=1 FL=1
MIQGDREFPFWIRPSTSLAETLSVADPGAALPGILFVGATTRTVFRVWSFQAQKIIGFIFV